MGGRVVKAAGLRSADESLMGSIPIPSKTTFRGRPSPAGWPLTKVVSKIPFVFCVFLRFFCTNVFNDVVKQMENRWEKYEKLIND
jgi:hypothetical protein